MKWFTRSSVVATASALLVIGAAALILRSAPAPVHPVAAAVAAGDREIVWLFTTTNATSWERFVAGVRRAAGRLHDQHPDLQLQIGDAAFPKQTTAIPKSPSHGRRSAGDSCFVGTSSRAIGKRAIGWKRCSRHNRRRWRSSAAVPATGPVELAWQLQQQSAAMPPAERPLLLLTTATADQVSIPQSPQESRSVDLTRVYPDRTFRYCFTNKQMAEAIMGFLMNHDAVRPNLNPVHMVQWDDDSYSRDLTDGFRESLPPQAGLPNPMRVASSVGSFLAPNRFEADVVGQVLQDLESRRPPQTRPLLVVTGQSAPSRRFSRNWRAPLRPRLVALSWPPATPCRSTPSTATGASCGPFRVFLSPLFSSVISIPLTRTPASAPESEGEGHRDSSATGTEDVLLNSAIVETVVQALQRDGRPAADAAELALAWPRFATSTAYSVTTPKERSYFGSDGNRRGGAGENIVYLRPHIDGDLVLAEATIEVWFSRESIEADRPWRRRNENQPPMTFSYEPPVMEERPAP